MNIKNNNKNESTSATFAGMHVPPDLKKAHFRSLYVASLFIACLMTMPAILQPSYLKDVIQIAENQAGLINSSLQNMGQIAFLLFLGLCGILSDKVGRRILVVMGCALCSIFFIVYGYTQELSLLFGITSVGDQVKVAYVIRFIIGVGLVLSFPQTTTMVADYVKPGDRGKGFALHGAMVAFASLIVFGVLAQIAPKTGLISLFYTAGILGLLGLLITQFGTVDRVPKEKARAVGFKVLYHTVMQSRALKVGYGVTLINRSDIAVIATFLVLWMVYKAETVGLTPIEATARASIVLVVTSVVTLIAYPIIGMLVDRWGRIPVTITGLAAVGIGFCLIAATTNPFLPVIYGYAALLGVGFIAAGLGSGAMTADAAPRKLLGSILGGLNTMQPIGMLFFLQLGGWLFDEVGPWAPFLLKGVANLICCVVTFAVCRKAEFSLDAGDT